MLGWGYAGAGPAPYLQGKGSGVLGSGDGGAGTGRGRGAANGCDRARVPRPAPPAVRSRGEPTVWGRAGGRCCDPVLLPPARVVLAVRVAMGSTPFCRRRRMAFFFFTGFHGKLKHLHRFA